MSAVLDSPPAPAGTGRRVKMAADPATPATVLAALARDGEVTVRAAAVLNPSLPAPSERLLATDADERVRLLLARKLAAALPALSVTEQADLRERSIRILSALVRDVALRIRAEAAGALAAQPDAPPALVLALAQDREVAVSEPVLRLSPLLSAADLLALLAAPPNPLAATAIACRANLPAAVSDAVVATADSPAIRALLLNGSASIKEGTLDALIARAAAEPDWQAPLVRRPELPGHAARALAEIVAGSLLEELAARPDLPPPVLESIRQRLDGHLARLAVLPPLDEGDALAAEARRLGEAGELTEARLLAALRAGEEQRACAYLAVAAAVPFAVVARAAELRSVKGLVSLVWKAGFSMRGAAIVQTALGRLAPAAVLAPTRSGDFPLRPEEMRWQLDFLAGGC